MDIQWFSKKMQGVVTIYETNLTLNTVASAHFENSYATVVGFDKTTNTLLIKSLTKEEAKQSNFSEHELHKISIKPSYGRINGKSIVDNIRAFFPMDFTQKKMYKYAGEWIKSQKMFRVYLDREVL